MATVLGWHTVVRKGEFKVGDKCVYIEIDSVCPTDNPVFDFLKDSKGRIKPIKTKKLKGVYSQGLVMPLSILNDDSVKIGTDVTEILGIKKKEDEIIEWFKNMKPMCKGDFPSFIPKTDEERVQTLQSQLDKYKGNVFVMTEKLDGTSFTAYIRDGHFGICSRNMEVEVDPTKDNPYTNIAFKYILKEKFEALRATLIPFDFAIQGEIIGNGIQSNKYKLNDLELYLYNFYNIDTGKDIGFYFSDYEEKEEFHGITLGTISTLLHVPVVPILGACVITNDIDTLVDMSKGDSVLRKGYPREGIVFRAQKNKELSKYGNRISFKAINPDFLCPSV